MKAPYPLASSCPNQQTPGIAMFAPPRRDICTINECLILKVHKHTPQIISCQRNTNLAPAKS